MMKDLCNTDPNEAAKAMLKLSLYPSRRQLKIVSKAIFSCEAVRPYMPRENGMMNATGLKAPLPMVFRAHGMSVHKQKPELVAAVQKILEKFRPVSERAIKPTLGNVATRAFDWTKRPPPYKYAMIEKISRTTPGAPVFVVLNSNVCCRKMFATRGTNGSHASSKVRIHIYGNGLVRATCFSKNGPCQQKYKDGVDVLQEKTGYTKRIKYYDQVGRWRDDESLKLTKALGFSEDQRTDPPIDFPQRPPAV